MQKYLQKNNIFPIAATVVFGLLVFVSGAKAASPTITSVVSNPVSPISLLTNTSIALTINGTNFASGAIAEIVGPNVGATIEGTSVVVVSSTQITANFDITTAYLGAWNVIVTNTDAGTVTSTGALTFTGSSSTYTSPVQDMYYSDKFGTLSYASTLGANTTITINVRAGNTPTLSGSWTTVVSATTTASGSVNLNSAFDNNRYIQYQSIITYSGSDSSVISTLDEVAITHNVMTLVSSPYDTTVTANKMNSMTWDQTMPGNSKVVFQFRTSADDSTWTSWLGPDGTVATWFTDHAGGDFMPASFRDGSGDRYFQYRAILIPDGTNYPTFSNVKVMYYTTLVPAITSISPVSVTSITNPSTSVTMTINGNDFMTGAAVKIINSTFPILATSVTVVNTNQINATFNFDSDLEYAGAWDVVVTNADATTVTSSAAFTISNNETISTSPVLDLGAAKWFNSATWTETNGTSTVKIRAGNVATVDGSWTDYVTLSSAQKGVGGLLTSLNNKRYVQYVATTLSPYTNTTNTVTFDDLQLSYSDTNNVGTFSLISSPYNTNSNANVLGKIVWTATLPDASTSVKFQLRTAPDSSGSPGTWTDWLGPDGTNTSYFVNSNGTDTMPSVFQTGNNDQWVQYKAYLVATVPGVVPTISNVIMQYSYNVPPAITLDSANVKQNSNGTFAVPYTLSETYDYLGNIAHGTSSSPIDALLFWEPDSGVTAPALTNSQTGIVTLNNANSQPIPTSGSMLIDNELITFDSVGCTGNQRNITARGAYFTASSSNTYYTTAAAHSAGVAVFFMVSTMASSANIYQTVNSMSATGTAGTQASVNNSFTWDPKNDTSVNINNNKLAGILFKVVANDADSLGSNNIGQSSVTSAQTLDLLPPTFTTQYYSDSGLTTSLGTNPRLKAGTYYIKISANESLSATPTISINAEGTNNDVTNGTTTLVSGNDYKYTRTITTDAAAVGAVLSDFSITGTDSFSNTATNVDPTNESTTAGYTDTTAPTASITYSTSNPVKSGTSLTITATFNESMANSPVPKISISGSNTVSATNMTKTDATHYYYVDTVGAGNGTATVALSTGTDVAGNVVTTNPTSGATFTVDNTSPTADIIYSTSNPVKSGASLTITATFNESMADSPIPKIAISGVNTLSATNMTKTDATHYYYVDTAGAGNGTATVALSIGTDLAGNVITSTPTSGATFIVDNTAPTTLGTATLSSYLNNTGNTTVSWSQTTETYFKDYLVQRKTGTGGTFATIGSAITNIATLSYADNSSLAEGTYYYQIIAEDTSGNTTTSSSSSAFVVDKTAPTLQSFTSSSPNSTSDPLTMYGTGDTINIQAVFSENLGNGSTMTIQLENTAGSQVLLNQVSGNILSGTYTVSGPHNGISDDSPDLALRQIISSSVTDLATNLTNTTTIPSGQNLSNNKDIIVDTVPPSLQSFSATVGNYKAGDNITITAHYNKSVKSSSNIQVKINSDGGTNTINLNSVSNALVSGTYTVQAGDNTQNLKVTSIVSQAVSDIKNNQLTDTVMPGTNIADGVLIDTTAPVITFSDDVNSTPNQSDNVTIHVEENNPASDKYIFSSDNVCNNKSYTSATSFGSDTSITFNTETNNGKYICTKVVDIAGNISYQASGSPLNIDITPPTGTIQINRSLSSGQIQLTASDPNRDITGLQMRSIMYDDDTTNCDFSSATWGDYTGTLDLNSTSDLTKACVEYQDVAGNTTTLTATPPETPYSFQYFDVSDPADYRVFLSWRIPTGHEGSKGFYQYQLFQCSDAKDNDDCTPDISSSPIATINQESTNYKTFLGLTNTDKYCYQIRFASHNTDGSDYSALSDKKCVVPSSESSSVTKNLAIQFPADPVPDGELFANQATIHWDTVNANDANEPLPADSEVCWRVHMTPTPNWNCRSYESYETSHAITISKATERLYDLMPDTEYDYQVRSKTSWGKTATADGPSTFTTKDGPVIKNIKVDPIGNTTATVTWTTENKNGDPLVSSSALWYASELSSGDLVTPKKAACDSTDVSTHTCNMTNLSIGTYYYYYVESAVNNATSQDSANGDFNRFNTLYDITPPVITANSGNPLILTDTQAALSWETDERANAWLLYDTDNHTSFDNFVDNDFDPSNTNRNPYANNLAGDSANLSHTFIMSLDSLSPNTTYYYRFVSQDTSGNVSVSQEYSFTTLEIQESHPSLTNPGNPLVAEYSDTEAVVYLPAANTEATSKICWDTSAISDVDNCANNSEINTPTKSHYYHLTSLTANTTYYIMTKITDSKTPNINFTSSDVTFTTRKEAGFQHPPLAHITNITTSLVTDENAVITFDTDQDALCVAEATTTSGSYINPLVFQDDGYAQKENYTSQHSIKFTGLIFNTTYYYKITCGDNLNTIIGNTNPAELHFTTLEKQYGASTIPTGDTTAPQISGVAVNNITGENATITWNTDEKANSLVSYAQDTATVPMMAGDSTINLDKNKFSTDHTVIISGLTSNIKYNFTVISYDVSGNIAQSSQSSLTTQSASSLSNINVVSKAMGQADITWKTNAKTSSVVEYGLDTTYGKTKQDSTQTTDHEILLSDLTPGTIYHFRVEGEDANKNMFASSDVTFQPKSPPKISNFKIGSIYEHGATITCNTDVPTDMVVSYVDPINASNSGFQGIPTVTSNHSITLNNMVSGVTYNIKIKVRDENGNETDEDFSSFTTGKDVNPPVIDNVHTDSALTQSNTVQSIITWKTDEESTSSIIYREGRAGEEKEFKNSDNLSTNHVVVITTFKAGTVYNFRVKSTDASGNTAISDYFSFLTPSTKANIIQIITSNFLSIFGWTSKMGK